MEMVPFVPPVHIALTPLIGNYGIAVYPVGNAFHQGLLYFRQSLKIHICNPQREKVRIAVALLQSISLKCAGTAAIYYFVKIVLHFITI